VRRVPEYFFCVLFQQRIIFTLVSLCIHLKRLKPMYIYIYIISIANIRTNVKFPIHKNTLYVFQRSKHLYMVKKHLFVFQKHITLNMHRKTNETQRSLLFMCFKTLTINITVRVLIQDNI